MNGGLFGGHGHVIEERLAACDERTEDGAARRSTPHGKTWGLGRAPFEWSVSASRRLLPLLLLLAGAAPGAAGALEEAFRVDLPRLGSDDPVELEADTLVYDRRARRAQGVGDVRLATDGVTLRADELVLDLDARFALATGDVVIEEGPRRLEATRLYLEIDAESALARDVLLTVIDTRTRALRLTLRAFTLERVGPDLVLGQGISFTPCDCPGDGAPSWCVSARSARIEPDRGAWLFGAWFRIRDVPVVPLPVFYLPLGERRTGLLTPRFNYSGRNGIRLAQPLYVVLGRSWDMTLAVGWYGAPDTWEDDPPTRPGVRGLDQALELRWAPARRSRGSLLLSHIRDVHRDDVGPEAPARGSRFSLRADHDSRFDDGGFGAPGHGVHANLNLLSDAQLLADLQPVLEQTQRGYLRSTARAHATPHESLSVELGGRWLQDIRARFVGLREERRVAPLFGPDAPSTAQLLPEAYSGLSPVPFFGGFTASADARLLSWRRFALDEPDEERQAGVLHARVGADVARSLRVGRVLTGRAVAGVRVDAWQGDRTGSAGRSYPRLDVTLGTALERRFGAAWHRLRPGVSWRLVPLLLGEGPGFLLDAFDRAIPSEGLNQLAGTLTNEVWLGGRLALDATVSQGVDLIEQGLADLDLILSLTPPGVPHRLDGVFGWDWEAMAMSWATAAATVRGEAGSRVQLRWTWVRPEGATALLSGLDEMFAAGALPPPILRDIGIPIHEAVLGFAAPRIRGLALRYDVSMTLGDDPRPPQHRVGASYVSVCRCWSASLLLTFPPGERVPEIVVGLDLAGLGSVSTRSRDF